MPPYGWVILAYRCINKTLSSSSNSLALVQRRSHKSPPVIINLVEYNVY